MASFGSQFVKRVNITQQVARCLCTAGWYCLGGANVSRPVNDTTGARCPPGYYCPAGSAAPVACPEGTFNANAGAESLANCTLCTTQ